MSRIIAVKRDNHESRRHVIELNNIDNGTSICSIPTSAFRTVLFSWNCCWGASTTLFSNYEMMMVNFEISRCYVRLMNACAEGSLLRALIVFFVISTSYTNPRKQIYFYLRVMSQMSTPQRLPGRHVPSKWSRWTSQLHQQIFVNWINCNRLKFLRHFFSFSLLFRHIHFRVINFYFFVVGHQKNNADKGNAKSGAQEIALRLRLCSMHSKINSR